MKKEVKRKRVNSSSKKTYSKKPAKGRVQAKKNIKVKNTILLASLILYVIIVIVAFAKVGKLVGLGIAVILGFIIGIGYLLSRLKGKGRKRLITVLIILFLLGVIAVSGIFAAFIFYIKTLSDPIYKDKKADLNKKETTIIYDRNGNEFARLGSEMRENVSYEDLPEVLIDAIVATEDSRYFQHNGFDAPRFVKASVGQVMHKSGAGGASTLSMQVVKNVFTDANADEGISGIVRKFQDIYLAVFKLEKDYTKEDIIEFYVNNHFLGGNIYGVEEASEYYFGKPVGELTLSEAAVIAGMFKSPNYYKPDTHPENAEARRSTVLYLMRKHGYITKEEEAIAKAIPVESLIVHSEVEANKYQGYIDTVVAEIKAKYKVNAYTTSLNVYTTLDTSRQDAVDRVMSGEAYGWIDDKVQSGVAVIESETGAVLAVGTGRNKSGINSYNYATQIRRQPGSTAKPLFDYGPGIEFNDWSTYQLFDDSKYSYSNGRSIKNWDGGYYGTITLRKALSTSRNIPALKAFQQVDNDNIRDFVTSLGIKPELCDSGYSYDKESKVCINDDKDTKEPHKLHEAHSIGAFTGVSPLEMAAAYAAFSNGGYYNEPYTVQRITFKSTGETIEHESDRIKVMSDATAFMIASVLQDVALTGGTPSNVACKTGTTNYDDNLMDKLHMPGDAVRDSWVVGFSTKTTIGMWYGYDTMNQEMVDSGYVLHNIPATIQKDRLFSSLVYAGAMEGDRASFQQPSSVVKIGIAMGTNPAKLAGPGTQPIYEYFKKGTEPTETATGDITLPGPSGVKAVANANSKKVTISWNAVDLGEYAAPDKGTFGYNIYHNNVLIGWTDKTSYEVSEYGTYKIVGTYKGFSGIKTEGAEVVIKEPEKDKDKDKDNTTDKEEDKTEQNP